MLTSDQFRRVISGQSTRFGAGLLRVVLRIAAVPYGIGVRIRNLRYDWGHAEVHRMAIPVVCVGNLTLGGTGKTPMVAWVCKRLRQRGVRVAIVSRGYRANEHGVNDEALELEQQLPDVPHLQNPDRVAAALVAQDELETQAIVLDDGFQHRRLHRDLNIVLVDATEPFGTGHLFPRGTLREPLSGLKRAHAVVLTRADRISKQERDDIRAQVDSIAPDAVWMEMAHQPSELLSASGESAPLTALDGASVAAFNGIGNPQGFESTLKECGCRTTAKRIFADHHAYTADDIRSLGDWARESVADIVVCTHKDLVKIGLNELGGKPLWAVTVQMKPLSRTDELDRVLESLVNDQTTST